MPCPTCRGEGKVLRMVGGKLYATLLMPPAVARAKHKRLQEMAANPLEFVLHSMQMLPDDRFDNDMIQRALDLIRGQLLEQQCPHCSVVRQGAA
jgi:hypothetical protein